MDKVKRYDCSNGKAQHCHGCYQMEQDELGDYVKFEDYEALRQQLASQLSEPVAYADVKFQHDKRWPPGISLHFVGGTGFGDLGKLGHGIHNLYTTPPSVDVLVEALREVMLMQKRLYGDGTGLHIEMNDWAKKHKNLLNSYSKPITEDKDNG